MASTAAAGLVLRLKLTPALHNFFGSMHGGAIASAVDVATTVAIVAAGGFPGVSTSLGVTYLAAWIVFNLCFFAYCASLCPRTSVQQFYFDVGYVGTW